MISRHHMIATACAAVIAATTAASAADTKLGDRPAYPTIMAASDTVVAQNVGANTAIRAETLIDQSVENRNGDTVGDIESVIVDASGEIRAVVIGVGGFLGMGERLVALDWNELEITENGDKVVVAATADQLKALPAYTYEDEARRGTSFEDRRIALREQSEERAERQADRREDRAERAEERREELADRREERAEDKAERREELAERKADRVDLKESVAIDKIMDARGNLKASELIGMDVVNSKGEVVGDIEEILVSNDGKISAVLGAGGILGMGETKLLVDWQRLEVRKSGDQAQIRTVLSNEDLQKLPQN